MSTAADKPMRRDAARNRERILEAAADLFAEHGLGVTLNEIARHAGVGVGTVYRHFPDRDELLETLLEQRVDAFVAVGRAALADPDPWNGLVSALERGLEMQASNRSLRDLVQDTPQGLVRIGRVRERVLPIVTELISRARDSGALRPDIEPGDLPLLQLMVVGVIDASRTVDPEMWRRYLAVVLRGIAADPDSLGPLPASAPDPDSVDRVMSAAHSPGR
jgi:AcrR family transcriptional regulator